MLRLNINGKDHDIDRTDVTGRSGRRNTGEDNIAALAHEPQTAPTHRFEVSAALITEAAVQISSRMGHAPSPEAPKLKKAS